MSFKSLQPAEFEGIHVCSISFNRSDRIRLIGLPANLIDPMRNIIKLSWGEIRKESNYHKTFEFKLSGKPWRGKGKDAIQSRRLLVAILRIMTQYGWQLLQAADVSKKQSDKDTLFFENGIEDHNVELFAMSFNMKDTIRIIDAPPSLAAFVEHAIKSQWPSGIQSQRHFCGSTEFKLRGKPWYAQRAESVYGRMLLCQILANIKANGFKLYGSVDISIGFRGQDLDSWVFRRLTDAWN